MTCRLPLFLLLTVFLLPGCSSDDDPAGPPTSVPTATLTPAPPATPTATRTPSSPPTASATETPSPTRTMTHGDTCCGDGTTQPERGEDCDDGNGIGGDGCAPNCTVERSVPMLLHGEVTVQTTVFALVIDLTSEQTVRVGGPAEGSTSPSCEPTVGFSPGDIPVTQRLEDVSFAPAAVPGLVCACVRPVAVSRCGPTLLRPTGPSCDIAPDCTGDASICGEPFECQPAHGSGNVTSGLIGCAGLVDVDYDIVADDLTREITCVRSGDIAPPGSAFLFTTSAIGTIADSGTCAVDESDPRKGADGIPCTEDDPEESRGVAQTTILTTGTVNGAIVGDVAPIEAGRNCGVSPCITGATGREFSCEDLAQDPPMGGDFRLCSVFAALDQPTTGDIVVPLCLEERVE